MTQVSPIVSNESTTSSEIEAERTFDPIRNIRGGTYLQWEEMNYFTHDRNSGEYKQILSACSGHVKPGEMVAIVGPSGCGKTSLLNLLANRVTSPGSRSCGTVTCN